MPSGLSRSCSLRVMLSSRSMAPRTTSLAGALCTPRVSSLRPQMPAMWPDGGMQDSWPGGRVHRLHPRPVERRVLRVVARLVDPPLLDLLGVEPGRRVEDRDPVAHQLAVGDHRQLHGLHGVEVDRALLVGAHQVGHAEHRDLVDGLQAGEAGALGDVADVVVGAQPGRRQRRPAAPARPARSRRSASRSSWPLPVSSSWTSFEAALTMVTTFCLPRREGGPVELLDDLALHA